MSVDLSGQRLGHYLVEEVLGRGGMSVVYRARDQRLERLVALKVMSANLSADPEFRARFIEEARAASAIDHVNVVPLYDFGEVGNLLFIAMRLVDGTDLARELAREPMPVRRVLNLLGQVGAALDMLHERGLVHLDVKPANVLITRNESVGNEHVYLADFGLTRRGPTGHRTTTGDFLGSPTYASPEHLRGQAVVPRSDEYSLTCMLFTALAGRAPFVGDVRTVVTGHLSGVVPSLSALTGLPSAIDRVIARGMAGDPERRYASSSDLLSAARRAIASLQEDAPMLRSGAAPHPPAELPPELPAELPAAGQPAELPGPHLQPVRSVPQVQGPGVRPVRPVQPVQSGTAGTSVQPVQPVQSAQSGRRPGMPVWPVQPVQPGTAGPVGWPVRPVQSGTAAPLGWPGPAYQPSAPRPVLHPAAVRPALFVPEPTGRRPQSHRIEPARPRWPWFLAAGLVLALLAVAVVVVVVRNSAADRPEPLPGGRIVVTSGPTGRGPTG